MFKPVNRYIVVEKTLPTAESDSLIVLPDDYKPVEEKFIEVNSVSSAEDVRFPIEHPSKLVIDASMIEEISVGTTNYSVILDNYVVGILE